MDTHQIVEVQAILRHNLTVEIDDVKDQVENAAYAISDVETSVDEFLMDQEIPAPRCPVCSPGPESRLEQLQRFLNAEYQAKLERIRVNMAEANTDMEYAQEHTEEAIALRERMAATLVPGYQLTKEDESDLPEEEADE